MLVKKKSEAGRWIKIVLLTVVPLAILGGAVYAVFYSGFFRVRSIEVKGVDMSVSDILAGRQFANILFPFPPIDSSKFPEVLGFTINKDYWNRKVTIEAKGRERSIIWCLEQSSPSGVAPFGQSLRASRCFWADTGGFIFSDAPEPSGSGAVRIVEDASGRDIGIGDHVLPEGEFANLLSGLNVLDGLRVPVSSVQIDNIKFGEFTAITTGGPRIYFSLLFDPQEDYDAVKSLAQSDGWKKLCYVDLRTELRVYTSKVCSD